MISKTFCEKYVAIVRNDSSEEFFLLLLHGFDETIDNTIEYIKKAIRGKWYLHSCVKCLPDLSTIEALILDTRILFDPVQEYDLEKWYKFYRPYYFKGGPLPF